ncbi:hypothetical protein C5Y96_21270 [Blastopirellula marina]|uniref:LamG-like jellyroll fold domain-containing protein n=1 Tax=Blastopirellula marina TaxID=124 RepID=A0A2S8F248_9BACT|nr:MULTISPECIES: LamG-like jellyroll fold domain-containing protein [Pirellulaceae]PQO25984.1 hypothetical protein C5Y96_21270 [Blastopirellula marina]RCS44342.1 hypothetical protein DTL36_21315 [Bremerella cremea]
MNIHLHPPRRQGFAVVIVLALLSVTLALSYSMMRVQSTTSQIQQNMSRQADARQAAISGLSAGMREMYESDWGGIDSTLQMNLGNNRSYQVSYQSGDAWLEADDPDYSEKPFRVTVVSTGYAFDTINPTVRSEYKIRAVVQLVRRKLQSNPSSYAAAAGHSMYSHGTGTNTLESPTQVHGKTFINGKLNLCEDWEKTNRPFHGLIDEIAIYDRDMGSFEIFTISLVGNLTNSTLSSALSTTGIRHWWRFNEASSSATVATDSAGSRNGTYQGGVYPGIDIGGGNKAVYLDGVSGRVDLGNMSLPNPYNFTIMAWVMPMTLTGNNEDGRILSKATHTNANNHQWMLSTTRSGGYSYPRVRLKTSSNFYERVPNSGALSTNSWVLLTLTFNSSTNQAKLYVNGTLRDSWTAYGIPQSSSDILAWIGDNPPGSARTRYLEATKSLADADQGDYRPLAGDVTLSSDRNELSTALTVSRQLGCNLSYTSTPTTSTSGSTFAGSTYRLYPGGKEYTIPLLSSTVNYQTLEPDLDTNPLGIFRSSGTVTLDHATTLRGTLIAQNSGSDIQLRGNPLTIKGVNLPALDGDSTVYQLPTLLASDDIHALYSVNATIEGAVAAIGDLQIDNLYTSSSLQLTGQAYVDQFDLNAKTEWAAVAYYSSYYLANFVNYVGHSNTSANFASWLNETTSAKFEHKVTIDLPETAPTYQWLDLGQPIYQKGDSDTGLVWELVRWKDDGGI